MSADRTPVMTEAGQQQQQQRLSSSRITRAEASYVVGSPNTSPATAIVAAAEPCAVGSMPIRPVAEPCSNVTRMASPLRVLAASGGVAQVPVAMAGCDVNRDGHMDVLVTGTEMNRDGISPLQGNVTSVPLLHQTHSPNIFQGGLTAQFPVTAPLHASPHPLQPRVVAAGSTNVAAPVGPSTHNIVEDHCSKNSWLVEIQRPPLARILGSSLPQSVPTAARTVSLQAGQDNSDFQHREPAFTDESQLFLLEQLADIGKSLDVINRASKTSEERCCKFESAIAEIRVSTNDLRRDINALQSRFLDMSEVPALGSVHNDMETLRTQHLYALSAIEEQRQENSLLHTTHGELRQLLTDHSKVLQELQVQVRAQLSDVQSDTSLISTQQQQANKLQELEAQVAKHIRDIERTPSLPADQHHRSQTHDSFIAEAERQEQTQALEDLTNFVQETRQEIFSTVQSAFDEVRSEIRELSEQVTHSISNQSNAVNASNGGIMTVKEPVLANGVCSGPLKISILGADGLRNADWVPGTGKSDPYCTCEILGKQNAAKIRTHVVKDNLSPTWDYEAELPEFAAGDVLVLKVFDEDFGNRDDFLGTLSLMSEQFYPHGFEGALPLQSAGKGITANLRLRIPPATVVMQPSAEAGSQRVAAPGQDPAVSELREQLGFLTEAVRNEFNGLHESFEAISSRIQGHEIALGGPDVVQLAAALEKEMAKRIESEALFQHELANVAVRVEQLSHRGPVDGESPRAELPVVQLALTKAEQSLVASSNLQDGVQEMHQEFLKLAEQLMRLEGGLVGLEDLRTKVDRIRAELDSPLEEY